jgi:hypothetical protein
MAANTRASSNPHELTMELRKFFGQSGKVYYVTHSPETYWKAFVETSDGFVTVEAKTAARDCGAQFEVIPTRMSIGVIFGTKAALSPIVKLIQIGLKGGARARATRRCRCIHTPTNNQSTTGD